MARRNNIWDTGSAVLGMINAFARSAENIGLAAEAESGAVRDTHQVKSQLKVLRAKSELEDEFGSILNSELRKQMGLPPVESEIMDSA
jgi:hypothetical protein